MGLEVLLAHTYVCAFPSKTSLLRAVSQKAGVTALLSYILRPSGASLC